MAQLFLQVTLGSEPEPLSNLTKQMTPKQKHFNSREGDIELAPAGFNSLQINLFSVGIRGSSSPSLNLTKDIFLRADWQSSQPPPVP